MRTLERDGLPLRAAGVPSLLAGADEWFDPERIDPDARWESRAARRSGGQALCRRGARSHLAPAGGATGR
ncbi:hypothetical protein ACU4GD_02480 [Cupriavidus basilensis]